VKAPTEHPHAQMRMPACLLRRSRSAFACLCFSLSASAWACLRFSSASSAARLAFASASAAAFALACQPCGTVQLYRWLQQ
jgi:hypothetical protein